MADLTGLLADPRLFVCNCIPTALFRTGPYEIAVDFRHYQVPTRVIPVALCRGRGPPNVGTRSTREAGCIIRNAGLRCTVRMRTDASCADWSGGLSSQEDAHLSGTEELYKCSNRSHCLLGCS